MKVNKANAPKPQAQKRRTPAAPEAVILPFPPRPERPPELPRTECDTITLSPGRNFYPDEIAALDAIADVIRSIIRDPVKGPFPTDVYPELRAQFFRDVVNARVAFEHKGRARMAAEYRREQRQDPDDEDDRGLETDGPEISPLEARIIQAVKGRWQARQSQTFCCDAGQGRGCDHLQCGDDHPHARRTSL